MPVLTAPFLRVVSLSGISMIQPVSILRATQVKAAGLVNGNHYRVAVLQADGNFDLERGNNRGDSGDMYRAGGVSSIGPGPGNHPNTDSYKNGNIVQTGISITDISASGSSMTFCYNGCGAQVEPLAPSGLNATANSSSEIGLGWADNSDNETGFRVERSDDGVSGWSFGLPVLE